MARRARDEEYYDEEDYDEGEESELPPGEPETPSEKLIAKTPWWAISIGLHTVAGLIVGFFWVVGVVAEEDAVVVSPPRKPRVIPEMEKPRDLDPNKKILDMEKSVEDPVYKKDTVESDHNETADEEEWDFGAISWKKHFNLADVWPSKEDFPKGLSTKSGKGVVKALGQLVPKLEYKTTVESLEHFRYLEVSDAPVQILGLQFKTEAGMRKVTEAATLKMLRPDPRQLRGTRTVIIVFSPINTPEKDTTPALKLLLPLLQEKVRKALK